MACYVALRYVTLRYVALRAQCESTSKAISHASVCPRALLVLPASSERSFSTMRRLRGYDGLNKRC